MPVKCLCTICGREIPVESFLATDVDRPTRVVMMDAAPRCQACTASTTEAVYERQQVTSC